MKKNKPKKIKCVIIGAGYMSEEYVKTIKSDKDMELYGIYSRTFSKAASIAKKYKIKKIFSSINEIKKNKIIDIVIIAISSENNNKISKLFLNTKFLILLEKPVGLNFSESKRLIDLTRKYRSKFYVALNRRFYDSTLELKKKLKKSQGKRIIEVFDCQNQNIYKKLRKDRRVVNSIMYANSIHLIDYFDMFCRGKIIKITTLKSSRENPDVITSKLKFSSGDVGFYYATWNRFSRWKIKITVKNKTEWVMQPLETLRGYKFKNNKLFFSKIYKSKYKDGLVNMLNEVKKAMFERKNNLVILKDHLNTIQIINKIYGK